MHGQKCYEEEEERREIINYYRPCYVQPVMGGLFVACSHFSPAMSDNGALIGNYFIEQTLSDMSDFPL